MKGAMRGLLALFGEGVAIARSQPAATIVTALVIAATSGVVLATVGQAAAAEQRLLSRIDEAGTRTIVLTDATGQAELRADSMTSIAALDGVEWALGLGPVVDVRNPDLGAASQPVPARPVYGTLPDPITIFGRPFEEGEALVGEEARAILGQLEPAGAVRSENLEAAVVGAYRAEGTLAFLNGGVLIDRRAAPDADLRAAYVAADSVDVVDAVAAALPLVANARSPLALSVEKPAQLLELRQVVRSELAANAWQLLLLVFGVGLTVVAATLFGAVSQRRRDFGRRRALGATRSAILVLVLTQALVAAGLGTILGICAGLVVLSLTVNAIPGGAFLLGVAVLTILTALGASVPPALVAAYRDPVRILRVA